MDLRRWYYFAVLTEEMNFTRAARRLYVSQPSLSQQIRALERDLGATLLDRSGPRFELTVAGRTASEEATDLLERVRHSRQRIAAAARGDTGRLVIAYTRSAPGPQASELVAAYRRRHPEVEIALETGWTSRNIALLKSAAIDIGFVRPPVQDPDVQVRVIGTEELLLALPRAHPLTEHEQLDRTQIANEAVVFWPRANGPGQYDEISKQVWPDGLPKVVREEPEDEQLMRTVAEGAGIAAVPEHRARTLHTPGVELRRLTAPVPRITLGIAHRAEQLGDTVRSFLELVDAANSD